MDKEATFPVPADLQNEITTADILEVIPEYDDGSGDNPDMNASDYTLDTTSYQNMKQESEKPVIEEEKPKNEPKKDTTKKTPAIGSPVEEKKEKKGFFKKLFGGKDKKEEEKKTNDY